MPQGSFKAQKKRNAIIKGEKEILFNKFADWFEESDYYARQNIGVGDYPENMKAIINHYLNETQ